jgi:hypothetical protein
MFARRNVVTAARVDWGLSPNDSEIFIGDFI